MKTNVVFEGGGMRALGIIGALSCLENNGFEWANAAGTSAGAIIAALLCAGYTSKDLRKLIINMNFSDFLDTDGLQRVPVVGKALGFLLEKGIYSGDYFERWMNTLLISKKIYTFKHILKDNKIPLKIITSDITNRRMIVIPDDLPEYGIDPMKFPIAKAVRMSISIPFYFKPVEFKHKYGTSYVVDGGVCCNFPIEIFDSNNEEKTPTIGFKFDFEPTSNTAKGKKDPLSFLFDIADTMKDESKGKWTKEKNRRRTIFIPTMGVESTEFNLSREKSILLYKSGYRSAKKFLENFKSDTLIKSC